MPADRLHPGSLGRFLRAVRTLVPGNAQSRPVEIAYALLVSDEIHNFVSASQIDLLEACGPGPQFHVVPHITLKLGFKAPSVREFEAHFDALVGNIEPFEIRVGNIGFFPEGIVFLDVEPSERLRSLRLQVLRELADEYGIVPHEIEGSRYHFHVTIARDLSPTQLARARQLFENSADRFRFVPEAAALLCHTGDQWVFYKRSRIGAPGS